MTLDELKQTVQKEHDNLNKANGVCVFSPTGPVGIGVIDRIMEYLETQQRRIETLESLVNRRD